MSFARTVLGDIPAEKLGACYAHEHLNIDASFGTEKEPDFLVDDVTRSIAELRLFKEAGGGAVVDAMPMAAGRNVLKLAEASRRSGVHIVAPTGLHLAKYYPSWHWSQDMDADELAKLFVADIVEGIDRHDNNGPICIRTSHRAGVIKIAGGRNQLSEREKRTFVAAGVAQTLTGAPILTHTEEGTAAMEQIELLQSNGADLRHVVLSHTDRQPDVAYHRDILQTGVRVEYDAAVRWKEGNPTLDLLTKLLPEFPDQVMLGNDFARRKYWTSYGGKPGLAFLLREFAPTMRRSGISEDLIDRVFLRTPAQALAFIQRSES